MMFQCSVSRCLVNCVTNTGGPKVVHDLSNYMENWCYGLKDPPNLAHHTDKWVGLLYYQITVVGEVITLIL